MEYKLDVKDFPRPESRMVFFKRLEECLMMLRTEGIIEDYSLSTPYSSTTIFRVKAEG
ncbi:unnamed protein product [marine sediment metagenome]|uniref:Uncharacterized protein n=1 Tax=marine sediment metagenome TaxID=412755 RepID=X1I865_9ZZZZ